MIRFTLSWILLAALAAGCAPDRSDEVARLNTEVARLGSMAGPPPAALDSLYPPLAKAPLYTMAMFEMATPLTGSMLKMSEGDAAAAMKYFDQFAAAYGKTSGLVPEWKQMFPAGPVEETRAAIREGSMEKLIAAAGKLGAVCRDCHLLNMPKVQQAYLWKDFAVITLNDPIFGRDVKFGEFMTSLDMSFTGIGIELGEGRIEKARGFFESFNSGMKTLRESCPACHETERAYFVDKSVNASIDALGMALKSPKPDGKLVGELSMKIAGESCGKCHLVHIPAAYAKARFREWNEPRAEQAQAD